MTETSDELKRIVRNLNKTKSSIETTLSIINKALEKQMGK